MIFEGGENVRGIYRSEASRLERVQVVCARAGAKPAKARARGTPRDASVEACERGARELERGNKPLRPGHI